jgi:hypothetical protein
MTRGLNAEGCNHKVVKQVFILLSEHVYIEYV